MSLPPPAFDSDRDLPSRSQAVVFHGKAALLRAKRAATDLVRPVRRLRPGTALQDAPVAAEISAEIWTHHSAAEFPLTAGKIQNLRVACAALDGLELPPGATFSFWKQVGRATRRNGYTAGRELREGCLIANRGGGLCQLSNLLYGLALDAGLPIIERHAHSRLIPGSLAEQDRDATVFWNYVDLRFRTTDACRLEARLSGTHLTLRLRAHGDERSITPAAPPQPGTGTPVRSNPSGDCLTCGMMSCFRHPGAAGSPSSGALGHTAFLLDDHWPEFQSWCRKHSQTGDRWMTPLDGHRWNKPNYAWSPPDNAIVRHATLRTLSCAFRNRRLPAQGALRQRALLYRDQALAAHYARTLDPQARHLVIPQNLLPHLWRGGVLGGRTFDVLMTRWPIHELQRRLDEAARRHPAATTLTDFRADPELAQAEQEALAAAGRLITPHRALAAHFGARALLLDWHFPKPEALVAPRRPSNPPGLFFPASPLGRKGAFELADALPGIDAELLILGGAQEDGPDPLVGLRHRRATPADLPGARALVLPAWIEHQPRLALRALANGIPVVASAACGLPEHPLLWQIAEPDPISLHAALSELLSLPESHAARHAV